MSLKITWSTIIVVGYKVFINLNKSEVFYHLETDIFDIFRTD